MIAKDLTRHESIIDFFSASMFSKSTAVPRSTCLRRNSRSTRSESLLEGCSFTCDETALAVARGTINAIYMRGNFWRALGVLHPRIFTESNAQ
jgi:hypothetical protein